MAGRIGSGWLSVLLLLLIGSCGGRSHSLDAPAEPPAQAGSGGAAGGATGQSGAGGMTVGLVALACRAQDARSNGARCAGVAGYAWNGSICAPIACGCSGSECDQVFFSMAACDRAYDFCYEAEGVRRDCISHQDCVVRSRTCCQACGGNEPDAIVAVRADSPSLLNLGVCLDPRAACPECESQFPPSVYAVCLDAQCTVYDASAHASCATDQDCHLVTKDCCACGGDFKDGALMSVNTSFSAPDYCTNSGCDPCLPAEPPSSLLAKCNPDRLECEVAIRSLK